MRARTPQPLGGVEMIRKIAVATVLVLGVALAAGCGGEGKSKHVARVQQRATTTIVGTARPASARASKDPYTASVRYVNCMRDHGIDLPDPDADGDLHLTPADEKRLGPPGRKSEQADKACFRHLRGTVKTKPLSDQARTRMADVMLEMARCMRTRGWEFGDPVVQNMSRGRVRLFFPQMSA